MNLTPPEHLVLTTFDNLIRCLDLFGSGKLKTDPDDDRKVVIARRQIKPQLETREEWGWGPPQPRSLGVDLDLIEAE